jgi:hypothetical protein
MTYRALLIGNSLFEADAGLNPLNAPAKDVARLHRALVDSATGLFAAENVRSAQPIRSGRRSTSRVFVRRRGGRPRCGLQYRRVGRR